jgi:hypothetical protein
MPAPKRPDPFRAPDDQEAHAIELAEVPRRATPVEEVPLAAAPPPPQPRRPVEYRRPGTSWVTIVILAFAAVGMAAVGGAVVKKTMATKLTPARPAPKPVSYSTLSKDDAILVTVAVSPRDARVLLDGEPAVSNPLRLLRSHTRHKLSAHAQGYTPVVREFTADGSKTIRLELTKSR